MKIDNRIQYSQNICWAQERSGLKNEAKEQQEHSIPHFMSFLCVEAS